MNRVWASILLMATLSYSQAPSTTAWNVLVQAMLEGNPEKRIDAIAALATLSKKPQAVRLIEAALKDKDASVRVTAAEALGEMESQRSVPALKAGLDDSAPEVSFAAARALWQLGDHSGREIFLAILAGQRKGERGAMRTQIGAARKKLRHPLGLGIEQVKSQGAALLGPFGLGVAVVEEMAKDGSASSRAISAGLLADDRNPESVQQLEDSLADKSWVVRVAAAKALGQFGRRASIPKLQPLLNDGKNAVRYMAAAAIVRSSSVGRGRGPAPTKQP